MIKNTLLIVSVLFCLCFGSLALAGNTPEDATVITPDNTPYMGTLGSGVENWFVFNQAGNNRYSIDFMNSEYNWKYMRVYYEDSFGNLIEQSYRSAYYNTVSTTIFIEPASNVFIKVYGSAGVYVVTANYIDTTGPDAYGKSCSDRTLLSVDAAPIVGTLDHTNPDAFEEDWFEFSTVALHQYIIELTRADNSDAWFELWSQDCVSIHGGPTTLSLVSWFGDDYALRIGGDAGGIGHYYTIKVTDYGAYSDDHGNTSEFATPIASDGTAVSCVLQYTVNVGTDEDWLVFTPQAYTRYNIHLDNAETNWKYMRVYQENEHGGTDEVAYQSVYNGQGTKNLYFEFSRPVFIKVYGADGVCSAAVEQLNTQLPDAYGKDCGEPTMLTVDAAPITGTLDHVDDFEWEQDWFSFQTQPMHKYQIIMTRCDNSDVYFQFYSDSCELLSGASNNMTIVSWYGDDYNLQVTGSYDSRGQYYDIQVIDLGLQPDDWPNEPASAENMDKTGGDNFGALQFDANYPNPADQDWMTFLAPSAGTYNLKLVNNEYNWKYIRVYRVNETGDLRELKYLSAYNGTSESDLELDPGIHHIYVYGANGEYSVQLTSPAPQYGDLENPVIGGDANKDGYVDMLDVAELSASWLDGMDL